MYHWKNPVKIENLTDLSMPEKIRGFVYLSKQITGNCYILRDSQLKMPTNPTIESFLKAGISLFELGKNLETNLNNLCQSKSENDFNSYYKNFVTTLENALKMEVNAKSINNLEAQALQESILNCMAIYIFHWHSEHLNTPITFGTSMLGEAIKQLSVSIEEHKNELQQLKPQGTSETKLQQEKLSQLDKLKTNVSTIEKYFSYISQHTNEFVKTIETIKLEQRLTYQLCEFNYTVIHPTQVKAKPERPLNLNLPDIQKTPSEKTTEKPQVRGLIDIISKNLSTFKIFIISLLTNFISNKTPSPEKKKKDNQYQFFPRSGSTPNLSTQAKINITPIPRSYSSALN